jgi:hypothetical protein
MSARRTTGRGPRRSDGESPQQAGPSPDGQRVALPGGTAVALADTRLVIVPDPEVPWWREPDGTRHSFGTLCCGLAPGPAERLREAHQRAIADLVAPALAAAERGDRREAARLATAAGRLCGEIAGRWPPHAVAPR